MARKDKKPRSRAKRISVKDLSAQRGAKASEAKGGAVTGVRKWPDIVLRQG